MESFNQRGQILIESVFAVFCIGSLLILFQLMIDKQNEEVQKQRLSKKKKEVIYVEKNENFKSK
jgi:hypothetical protein